jgi:hypothetical protein
VQDFAERALEHWQLHVMRRQRIFEASCSGAGKNLRLKRCVQRRSWRRRHDGIGSVLGLVQDTIRLRRGWPRLGGGRDLCG